MSVAIVIPAHNEAPRVGLVVRAARGYGAAEVVVVDDGSTDGTGAAASSAGALAVRLPHRRGKGAAMAAGLRCTRGDTVVYLDADLTGLQPQHIAYLVQPVAAGSADMAVGRVQGQTDESAVRLSGQRAMDRAIPAGSPSLASSGYGAENALMYAARRGGARVVVVPLPDVGHHRKLQKWGPFAGTVATLRTHADLGRGGLPWWPFLLAGVVGAAAVGIMETAD